MSTRISAGYLWHLAQSLSLDNQRWLADKLYENIEQKQEETLAPYTMEELNARLDEFEAELEKGEKGYSLKEFDVLSRQGGSRRGRGSRRSGRLCRSSGGCRW